MSQYNDGSYAPNANDYSDIVTFYNSRPTLYQNSTVPVVSVKQGRSKFYDTGCEHKMDIYASPFRYGYNSLDGYGNSGGDYFTLYNAYMSR